MSRPELADVVQREQVGCEALIAYGDECQTPTSTFYILEALHNLTWERMCLAVCSHCIDRFPMYKKHPISYEDWVIWNVLEL